MSLRRIGSAFLLVFCALGASPAAAAPKAELWPFWSANDPASTSRIDHALWDRFLKRYLVTNHPSGVNRVRYAAVAPDDRKALAEYVANLQKIEVTRLSRPEQNMEVLLEKGAREYVNHPRGAGLNGNRLRLSSIYDWFRTDFGGSEEGVLQHINK